MTLRGRQIANHLFFLVVGLGLGALASAHHWLSDAPGLVVATFVLLGALGSAISLRLRPSYQIGGWGAPFTLVLAGLCGFFVIEHVWLPATALAWVLLADLGWAVAGRMIWELENRPFSGPPIELGVSGTRVAPGGGMGVGMAARPYGAGVEGGAGGGSSALDSAAVAKAILPRIPVENFASIVGMDDVKRTMSHALSRALEEPEAHNGILLFGPPGNGKTLFVRATCGELHAPMVELSVADLVSPHHGHGPRALSDAFDQACRAPGSTVLFLDEIDAVLTDRASRAASQGDAALLTQVFLTKVSEARGRGLVVVGATNFAERLDPAAIREGRFDHRLEIPNPDAHTRALLLERFAPAIPPDARAVAVQRLAGFSTARLLALTARATEMSPGVFLRWPHLERALRDLQGTTGTSLDGVPALSELTLNPELGQRLRAVRDMLAQAGELLAAGGAPPSGMLFSGPSGTGKTLAAKALAKELGLAFFPTTGYDLTHDEGAIDRLFRKAAETRPSLVFIDEAEDVLALRQASGNGLQAGLSGKMLTWLDGATGKPMDVFVVAATNHPERVDPAFLRPGRLTEHIRFTLPEPEVLAELCARALGALHHPIDPKLTPEIMAASLAGATPAAVDAVLDKALSHSLVHRRPLDLPAILQARAEMEVGAL